MLARHLHHRAWCANRRYPVFSMIFRRGFAEGSNFLCSTLAETMKQTMQRCRRSQSSCFTLERVRHLSCARIPTKTLHCLYLYHARIRACSLTRTHRTDAHAPTSEHKAPQLHTIHTHVGAAALAAGYLHTCALLTGGGIECWGDNDDGQLGTGDTSERNTPTRVTGLGSGASVCVSCVYDAQRFSLLESYLYIYIYLSLYLSIYNLFFLLPLPCTYFASLAFASLRRRRRHCRGILPHMRPADGRRRRVLGRQRVRTARVGRYERAKHRNGGNGFGVRCSIHSHAHFYDSTHNYLEESFFRPFLRKDYTIAASIQASFCYYRILQVLELAYPRAHPPAHKRAPPT